MVCNPSKTILKVEATFVEPVTGEEVSFTLTGLDSTKTSYTVKWFDITNNKELIEGDKFAANTEYEAQVTISPANGYSFVEISVCEVNSYELSLKDGKYIRTIKYNTGAEPISSVKITVNVPVIGEKPDNTPVIDDDRLYVYAAWFRNGYLMNEDDVFSLGNYHVFLGIYVKEEYEGYVIFESTTVTVNGDTISNPSVWLTYIDAGNYSTEAFTPTTNVSNVEIISNVPYAGETTSRAVALVKEDVTTNVVWYNYSEGTVGDKVSKFESGKQYLARYTVDYKDTGYILQSTTTATVNGQTATNVKIDTTNNTLTCDYIFTEVESMTVVKIDGNIKVSTGEGMKPTELSEIKNLGCNVVNCGIGTGSLDYFVSPEGKWYAFAEGKEYSYLITLQTGYGCEFNEASKPTVNGEECTVYASKQIITIIYEFEAHAHNDLPTCTTIPYCEICNAEYGKLNFENHSGTASVYVPNNNGTHNVNYDCCNELHSANVACVNSEATCTEKAKCEHCGAEHSNLNPENHSMDTFVYVPNEDVNTHSKQHECCGAVVIAEEAHTFGSDNKCTACGMEKGHVHTYPDSWTTDSEYHWKLCDCGHKNEVAAHHYTEGSSCDVCGYENKSDGGFPVIAIVAVVAVVAIAGVGAFFYLRNKP